RDVAVKLNVPLSQAANLVLETGIEHLRLEQHLVLDSDLDQKRTEALLEADSDTEIIETEQELYQRQVDRNRERSDLSPEPQ
ncbi:hypothetical protein, partial [Edwardsiella tarda]|uniref:hypothetical protein n=1 Tax=Edwardsiella tarda TaxID=636 RepID=UPI001C3765A9